MVSIINFKKYVSPIKKIGIFLKYMFKNQFEIELQYFNFVNRYGIIIISYSDIYY